MYKAPLTKSSNEEWKDCPSVPGYQISSLGRVRGKIRIVKNSGRMFIKKAAYCKSHIEPEKNYVFVRLNPQGRFAIKDAEGHSKTRKYYIHKLVAEAFIGPLPFEGAEVDHIDRNRQNNTIGNLRYVTRLENAQNRVLDIRTGTKCNFSKLTEEQATQIKHDTYSTNAHLAQIFKVSPNTIRRIRNGESWTHLPKLE